MHGIDRMGCIKQAAEIEVVPDEVEYLFEVIPPELQGPAEQLIDRLRAELETAQG